MSKRGKHQSVCKDLKNWINILENHPKITKVIMGRAENARHKFNPGHIIFRKFLKSGIHYTCYTGNGLRQCYVYCEPIYKNDLKTQLEKHLS